MTAATLQKVAEAVCVKGWCAAHTRSGCDVLAGRLLRDRSRQAPAPQGEAACWRSGMITASTFAKLFAVCPELTTSYACSDTRRPCWIVKELRRGLDVR